MLKKVVLAAASALLVAGQASAALVFTPSEAAFQGALIAGSLKIESNIDNVYGQGDSPDPVLGMPLLFVGSGSANATLFGLDQVFAGPSDGRHAIDGDNYWLGGETFSIAFENPVQAFGFWGTDIGDFGASRDPACAPECTVLTVQFYLGANLLQEFEFPGSADNGSELFFGFVDASGATYDRVVFINNTSGLDGSQVDSQGFDKFQIGAVERQEPPGVPEPGSLALLGAALLGLAGARRRKSAR